ncbi:DUF559 domain-containing protein [Herbiconiux sp.]|uniref:endonuclease domain-containing protein n=1 Tax=Herbiconiux sp. TaxID=1871186 RepID=UPI0025B961F6|nr:DUF559 domain-containing protein [Herbiconiux sp.]
MPRRVALPDPLIGRAFTVAEARSAGLGEGRLRSADLVRPYHGVRARAPDVSTTSALAAAYQRRAPASHFFSHLTAARLWRVPLPRGDAAHPLDVAVLKPEGLPRSAAVRGHRLVPQGVEVTERFGLRVADAASTWCQLGALLGHDDLVAAADHLVLRPAFPEAGDARPYVELTDLAERASSYRSPGAALLRRAIGDVRQGVESRPETHLRLLIVRGGLPEPEPGAAVLDSRGAFVARVDLLYRELRVIVEYDGEQHRTDDRQYEKDLRRLEHLRELGWTVVVVRGSGLYRHPAETVRRIAAALGSAAG